MPDDSPIVRVSSDDLEAIRQLNENYRDLKDELAKVIVGQTRVIEELLAAIFARGHCLMQGVPGLAQKLDITLVKRPVLVVLLASDNVANMIEAVEGCRLFHDAAQNSKVVGVQISGLRHLVQLLEHGHVIEAGRVVGFLKFVLILVLLFQKT